MKVWMEQIRAYKFRNYPGTARQMKTKNSMILAWESPEGDSL
ncbi:MAG: hypothetical protein OH316_00830 [Candidatus Parvarchaeota archaeon]|nr:hypothetical protein [Candidatus Parvarchaeota archaeon]